MNNLTSGLKTYEKYDYAKSSIMYILEHFKPHMTMTKEGPMYLRKPYIDFSPDTKPDIEKMITSEILFVIDKIGFLPNWFNTTEYMQKWKKYFYDFLNEHNDLKKLIDKLESGVTLTPDDEYDIIINSFKKLNEAFRNSYEVWHEKSVAEFLDSNLPFELYGLYNLSNLYRIATLDMIVKNITDFSFHMHLSRGNSKKMDAMSNSFDKKMRIISNQLTSLTRSELIVRMFLKLKNSKTIDDLFTLIPLKLAKEDEAKFNDYLDSFRNSVQQYTGVVEEVHLNKSMELLENKEKIFLDFKNDIREILVNYE